MNFGFIEFLIINYFRILLILSVISKLLFPVSFQSYSISFLKYVGFNKFITESTEVSVSAIVFILYLIIQVSESFVLFSSFHSQKIFKISGLLLFLFLFAIVFISYSLNIPGDCGCFGDIIEIKNSIWKVIFMLINLLLIIFIIINKKF